MSSHFDNIFREGLICIILGAIFEMHFEVAMNSAKDIVENNIRLAVHMSQIELRLGFGQIIEFQILNDTCPLTSTTEDKCNEDKCINDDDDECCCINLLADDAYKGEHVDLTGSHYKEIITSGLLRDGKYTIMKSYLTPAELSWGDEYNQGMGWHRSEDRVFGLNPYRGYLTNKKWIFNEDSTIYIYIILFVEPPCMCLFSSKTIVTSLGLKDNKSNSNESGFLSSPLNPSAGSLNHVFTIIWTM